MVVKLGSGAQDFVAAGDGDTHAKRVARAILKRPFAGNTVGGPCIGHAISSLPKRHMWPMSLILRQMSATSGPMAAHICTGIASAQL